MSITCLPQGSSRPTHKSLLLWHRWDKADQFPNPCPRTPLPSTPHPHPHLLLRSPCPSGNLRFIQSPSPDPQAWFGPPLPSPHKPSALAFCCCRDGGWVHAGHTCMGEHAQCRGAPTCGLRLRFLSPHLRRLRVKSRKKGHRKKRSLYVVCTRLGHIKLRWPRNTVEGDKANAEWLLRHTGTVVTPREVFKNCPDSFLLGWKHG